MSGRGGTHQPLPGHLPRRLAGHGDLLGTVASIADRPLGGKGRRTLTGEIPTPHHDAAPSDGESLGLPVEELLRRGRPPLPYGDQVIDDLTPENGEAFLDAVRS